MTQIFNKLLLAATSTCLFANIALAQDTICFKNDIEKPSMAENIALDGEICEGKLSLNQMKEAGWEVLDIKITSLADKFNYRYFLTKAEQTTKTEVKKPETLITEKNFSIKPIGVKIENINENKSSINVGNLIIGQTGIVVHIYDNDKRLIVSNAKVISSNNTSSVVEFFSFDDLKQDALPTTKRVVTKDDILVLNYMYNSSMLIAPTQDTFQTVRENFKLNNFLHSDIFAAKLKVENNPYPTKEDIQKFAIEQNLGTIFFVLDNKVFVVDTKTFTILESYAVAYENKDLMKPFYTRVEEIEESIFDFSFFSDKKSLTYDEYYKRILGLK